MEENNKLDKKDGSIIIDNSGLVLRTYDDLFKFSTAIFKSKDMCPKHLQSPESVMVAIQMGLELGLKPMQSIQNIAVINGIPSIFGDAAKALVLSSGLCIKFEEFYEGVKDTDSYKAVCITHRKGDEKPLRTEFSIKDAKTAKLWGKQGTWTTYYPRMLKFRARGFNLRDNFPDILKGFKTVQEVEDYEIINNNSGSNTIIDKNNKTDEKRKNTFKDLPPDEEVDFEEVK